MANRVQRVVVVVDEQGERRQRRQDREAEGGPGGQRDAGRPGSLAGRERHHQGREHPHGVDRAARLVGPGGGCEQVDGVGDGEQGEPGGHAPQTHRRAPPEQGQQRGHDKQQQHVQQRVRERRDDRCGAAAGDGKDRTEERGSDTGDREAADDAVEPQAERDVLGELADDEVQRDEGARVEAQPQRVSRRRERFRVSSADEHRPDDVAEPVQRQADAEHVEAPPVRLRVPGPQEADGARCRGRRGCSGSRRAPGCSPPSAGHPEPWTPGRRRTPPPLPGR